MTTWCESYDLLPDPGELGNLLGYLKQQAWVIFHVISMSILMEFLCFCLWFLIHVRSYRSIWVMYGDIKGPLPRRFLASKSFGGKARLLNYNLNSLQVIFIDLDWFAFICSLKLPQFPSITHFTSLGDVNHLAVHAGIEFHMEVFLTMRLKLSIFASILVFLSTLRDKRSWGISTCFFSFSSYCFICNGFEASCLGDLLHSAPAIVRVLIQVQKKHHLHTSQQFEHLPTFVMYSPRKILSSTILGHGWTKQRFNIWFL